jgi:hypothetical protein
LACCDLPVVGLGTILSPKVDSPCIEDDAINSSSSEDHFPEFDEADRNLFGVSRDPLLLADSFLGALSRVLWMLDGDPSTE